MTSAMQTWSDRLAFFVAVNTGFVSHGIPDHRFVDFYQHRSSPQLHCAIVGNVVVADGFGTNSVSPTLTSEPIWAELTAAIRRRGSKPGIQLASTWRNYVGAKNFVASEPDLFFIQARQLVEHLGSDGVESALTSFANAADLAIRHGFEHIQIHAAHGYLINLLIDHRINRNAAFALDRLAGLAEALKLRGIETSIRISLKAGNDSFDSGGGTSFHNTVAKLPFDFIDLSSGFYNIDKRLIYPARHENVEDRLRESISVGLRHPNRDFIISGRASHHDWTEIPNNIHLGLCRDLIANPNFLQMQDSGCRNHGKCHYFSRGTDHLVCAMWHEPAQD